MVRVDPEHFGPVRVTATIGADGVRIELMGVTEAAREALRSGLADLRRDLAASGLNAYLDLADDAGSGAKGGDAGGGSGNRTGAGHGATTPAGGRPSTGPRDTTTTATTTERGCPGGLDVLA